MEENLPEFYSISEDLEHEGVCHVTMDAVPILSVVDESYIAVWNERMVDLNLSLLNDSCVDEPNVSKSYNLGSHHKDTDVVSSLISMAAHFTVIFAIAFSTHIGWIGQYGNSSDRVFVNLIDPNAVIVQQNRHASFDSAASSPSIAKRSKKEQGKREEETSKNTQKSDTDPEKGENYDSNGSSDKVTTNDKNIKLVEKDISPSKNSQKNDNVNFDSPSMQDSVASLPSEASQEQRSAAPQGEEADKFKKRVLSAIYKAAYYPRDALRQKEYGEASVSFTIVSNGSIECLTVVKKSGSEILDKAALNIVEKASAHFPAIPETLGHNKINYVVPITFKKRS